MPPADPVITPDFRALFESTPACCLVLDSELTIVAVTDAYLVTTMTERGALIGRQVLEAFPDNPEDASATGAGNLAESLDRVLRTGAPHVMPAQRYDIRQPESVGGSFETRWWSIANSPLIDRDGEVAYILNTVEDITELVRLKELRVEQQELTTELQLRTAHMESEVLLRSNELIAANRRLREASAAKSEFLSRMSHELRTPLNAILGFGQLLQMEPLAPHQLEFVEHAIHAGRHLLVLIDEVLDIARVESGHLRLSIEPVRVADVLDSAIGMVQPLADARPVRFLVATTAGGEEHVLADRQRMQQAVVNLLANAVKYNRVGGEVRIDYSVASDGLVRLVISDTGVGMTSEDLGRLFSPFERLGADQTDVEGSGLGLALTKYLVEAMGGRIGVESQLGTGSSFWIDLPQAEAPIERDRGQLARQVAPAPASTALRTVLYVEDNLSNIRLVEQILARRRNVSLIVAMEGRAALDLAREHLPEVILLDLHLPDMSGEELLLTLRADERMASATVAVLSADATPSQIRRLLESGADHYLTKPFEIPDLLAVIEGTRLPEEAGTHGLLGSRPGEEPLDAKVMATIRSLAEGLDDGAGRVADLVTTYLDDAGVRLARLHDAVVDGDLEAIMSLPHNLGGSSSSFAAKRVALTCSEIHVLAGSGDLEGIVARLAELDAAFAEAAPLLRAAFLPGAAPRHRLPRGDEGQVSELR